MMNKKSYVTVTKKERKYASINLFTPTLFLSTLFREVLIFKYFEPNDKNSRFIIKLDGKNIEFNYDSPNQTQKLCDYIKNNDKKVMKTRT